MNTRALVRTVIASLICGHAGAQAVEFMRENSISNLFSVARAVTGDGHTAVGSIMSDDNYYGIRWHVGQGMEALDPSQTVSNLHKTIYGTNDDGSVVVGSDLSQGSHPFLYSFDNGITMLGDLMGGNSAAGSAKDVNADGTVVVGWSAGPNGREAFRWTAQDGMVGLGSIPGGFFGDLSSEANAISADGSTIVGQSNSEYLLEPVIWTETGEMVRLGLLPGAAYGGEAVAVNADGTVVVGRAYSTLGIHAFRWTPERGMESLGDLPGGVEYASANAVSADGSIIVGNSGGYHTSTNVNTEPFIWTEQDGMRSLIDVLEDDYGIVLRDFRLHTATGISSDGRVIVGTGVNERGVCQGWTLTLPKRARPIRTTGAMAR